MLDNTINARCLLSCSLWFLSAALFILGWILSSDELGRLSLMICGGAVTVSVKMMFVAQTRHLKAAIRLDEFARPLRR